MKLNGSILQHNIPTHALFDNKIALNVNMLQIIQDFPGQ